jgi:hypothetical protein
MGKQNLMDDVDAVGVLEIQQRRHDAHARVDECMPHNLAIPPLN